MTEPGTAVTVREMPDENAPQGQAVERLNNEQIRYIASTEIVPKHLRGKPDAILATILKGRALGLDDIHALTAIHFIEGKATLAAETMVTLVRRSGHSITLEAKHGESCTARGRRRDNGDEHVVTWTKEMAQAASLIGKDNWKRYFDTMLAWRATSQLCRFLFPDVLMGVSYTQDEAEEAAERGAVTEAVSDLPGVEETRTREEPTLRPSDAQLNRIARLEQRSDEAAYRMMLRGVFGVEMASELDTPAAERYERALETALEASGQGAVSASGAAAGPERSAGEVPGEDEAPTPPVTSEEPYSGEASPSVDAAVDSPEDGAKDGKGESSSDEPLPGEPGPEDEVLEGEVVEESAVPRERLIELAAETPIPIGNYRGKTLAEIHDGWLEYALRPTNLSRLPAPFVEALELYVQERKPEIWATVRG